MKYLDLVATVTTPIFSRHELDLRGLKVHDYQLTLWGKKGYIRKLKNGLYAYARDAERLSGEVIAFHLYQPCYVSLESALSHYGFIPEMVYSLTSVTTRTTRKFDNDFGHFIFRHVRKNLFWGYTVETTECGPYLLAEPEKALLDYLYLNMGRLRQDSDFEAIRLNEDAIADQVEAKKLMTYAAAYGVKKLEGLARKCLHWNR